MISGKDIVGNREVEVFDVVEVLLNVGDVPGDILGETRGDILGGRTKITDCDVGDARVPSGSRCAW